MSSLVSFEFPEELLDERFTRFGSIANQESNGFLETASKRYMRVFTAEKLGKTGPYTVKPGRKAKKVKKKAGEKAIAIAKKARIAGFRSAIRVPNKIEGKSMEIRTKNPLLLLREFGGVIRPRRARPRNQPGNRQYVMIYGEFKDLFKGTRGARQLRNELEGRLKRQLNPQGLERKRVKPIVAKVRQVRYSPILGLIAGWRRFEGELGTLLRYHLGEIHRRGESVLNGDGKPKQRKLAA